jgi:hypothetical protein
MTKFRDFGSGPSSENLEPISFKLHNEEFFCIPEIQGAVLLEIVGSTSDDNPAKSASMITEFFGKVLTDESYERFDKLITSKDRIVRIETLGEITGWIIEEYSNRPEKQPEA